MSLYVRHLQPWIPDLQTSVFCAAALGLRQSYSPLRKLIIAGIEVR